MTWHTKAKNWKGGVTYIEAEDERYSGKFFWQWFASKKMIDTILKYEPWLRITKINDIVL